MASRLGIAEVRVNDCFQRYAMRSSHPQRMAVSRPLHEYQSQLRGRPEVRLGLLVTDCARSNPAWCS